MRTEKQRWLERPIHPAFPGITKEIVIFAAIILIAIITRFYDLETRVMSHDESLHTYFSWLHYRGQGYQHSPMMHGPFQLLANGQTEFGPGDPGYLGGRWWVDVNGNNIQDSGDSFLLCMLLGPGRTTP